MSRDVNIGFPDLERLDREVAISNLEHTEKISDLGAEAEIPILVKVTHPFGKGLLTTTGVQYGTEVTGITHTAFGEVGRAAFHKPEGYTLESLELGLTAAIKSSAGAKHIKWKFQGSDDGVNWSDLIAEQTRTADASAYADVSISGRWRPDGSFSADTPSSQIRFVIHAEDANETVSGKVKNSCYVLARYMRS